jgi:hypothetical protein
MKATEYTKKFTEGLFWDIDMELFDMDKCPAQIIQRVLEYGDINDWNTIRSYYGLDKIVEVCQNLRTLDPVCLSFICCISNTQKEEYRCYHARQSNPAHWSY